MSLIQILKYEMKDTWLNSCITNSRIESQLDFNNLSLSRGENRYMNKITVFAFCHPNIPSVVYIAFVMMLEV